MEKANKKGAGRKPTNHTVASPFATKLKAVFWDSGLTQSEAAEKLGVSRQTFNNWLNGQNQPDYSYLIQISKLFGVSCDYLLGVSDVKTLDMDISGCCKLTGLSEAAVNRIIEFSSKKSYRAYTDLLSLFIENPNMEYFLNLLEGYITSGNDTDDKQLGMSRFSYSTKDVALLALNNILKQMLNQLTLSFLTSCKTTELLLIDSTISKMKSAVQDGKMTAENGKNAIDEMLIEIEELNKKYQSIIQELKNGGLNNG